ncbi:MAG: hypothetical protein QM820_59075 [Minicystis sp.]
MFALLTLSCCVTAVPPAPPPTPAGATAAPEASAPPRELTVTYREAASVFEILDNVTGWWKGKCDPEYREAWQQRFGVTPDDERRFAAYKEIRKRYYPRPTDDPTADPATTENGLFAPLKAQDRFAETFYAATTVDAALSGLGGFMTPDDVETLKGFYAAYRAPIEVLLAESRAYVEIANVVRQKLDDAKAASFYRRVAGFYGVTEPPQFTVLYVWWPPVDSIMANNRGSFLLMKYNPEKHRDGALRDIEIPVHEFTHYISAHQPSARKQALTKAFLAGCDMRGAMPTPKILEEPLAEAHQKLFLRFAAPERLDFSKPWYKDLWIDALAKAIYQPLGQAYDSGGTLDEALMGRLAAACKGVKPSP